MNGPAALSVYTIALHWQDLYSTNQRVSSIFLVAFKCCAVVVF